MMTISRKGRIERRTYCSMVIWLVVLIGCVLSSDAWVAPLRCLPVNQCGRSSPFSPTRLCEKNNSDGPFGFLSPYESKIPEELRDEIYQAEANTPAAQERGQRVASYALVAFLGILAAFFNGFLTELRGNGPDGSGVDLTEAGFGWVVSNFVFSFLFTNKIGGALCLLGGAGSGLLAEAELDTKRINAEKIYEELERRREAKNTKKQPKSSVSRKKRRSGKEKKRLSALSEVVVEEKSASPTVEAPTEEETKSKDPVPGESESQESDKKGLFSSVKDLYDQADTIAASQALLLNKKLEDVGVVEKITDETGLRVIGRDEAAKIKEDKRQESSKD